MRANCVHKRIVSIFVALTMIVIILPQSSLPTNAVPGETYQIRMVRQGNGTDFNRNDLVLNTAESEHFQLVWGNGGIGNPTASTTTTAEGYRINRRGASVNSTSDVGTQAPMVTDTLIRNTLRNLEICYDVYVKTHGYTPPSQSVNAARRQTDGVDTHYKINMVIQNTGILGHDNGADQGWGAYAGRDIQDYPFMMMVPDALRPNSNVISHEFMHCVVFANGWGANDVVGPWHESMANYGRDLVESSPEWRAMTGNNNMSENFHRYMQNLAIQPAHPRAYYQAWPILVYLTEVSQNNPDKLSGYDKEIIPAILAEARTHEPFFETLDRIFPNADFKDTLGHYAKRMATQDISATRSTMYRTNVNNFINSQGRFNQVYTVPEVTGKPNTYAVPTDRAPQPGGINIIPVTLTAARDEVVEVTLNGLTTTGGADWRFAIAIEDNSGVTTYSNLAKPGEAASITVPRNASRAFVTVTATPSAADFIKIGFPNNNVNTRISATATERQDHRESAVNYNQKNRYPYEITLKGATRTLQRNMSNSGLVRHVNGGGWIASASRVDASVYVGPNARVLGSATVRGNAVIDGYAVVEGSAAISENARIDGFAYVAGNARVSGRAHVTDRAFLMGNVAVSGDAKIMGSAWMHERAGATDNTIIQGMSEAHGNTQGTPNPNAYVTGQGIADGDYFVFNRTHNRGVVAGYIPADGYFTNRPFTDGLHHGYDFAESKITSPIIDRRHGTYASPYGEPLLEATRTSASGVLTLNGHDQYVNVSRNVSMFRDFEIQTAVLWRGGAANQKVFHFGDKDEHMYFTPSNENGVAEFVIKTEDAEQRLTANAPLPLGRWTVVTIRKVGNTGTLTFNVGGKIGDDTPTSIPAVTNGTMFLNPVQVSGKHDDEAVYSLGRGVDGEYFNGSYDYFDVYFKAAPAPTYGYTEMEEISLTCDHLFPDEWELVTPADCYQDGEESRVCMREGCDVTEERAVKANKVISLILDEYVAVGNHADTALSLKGLYLFDADAVDDTKIEEWWRMPALIMQGDSFLFFGDGLKYTRIGFKTIHTERLRLVTADGTSVACWNAAGVCIC